MLWPWLHLSWACSRIVSSAKRYMHECWSKNLGGLGGCISLTLQLHEETIYIFLTRVSRAAGADLCSLVTVTGPSPRG